ncbi:MAG: hypothetical protein Tsb0020_15050 [Haliangiales bacterium]
MAKKTYTGPAERLEAYEAVVATQPEVSRKGAANPYTSLNGHMFSFLDAEGAMCLRLSPDEREEFLRTYDSQPAVQYGRTMKEYVVVPAELLTDTSAIAPWFARSLAWIGTLKAKPTTAKKPAAKKAAAKKTAAEKPTAEKPAAKKAAAKKTAAAEKPTAKKAAAEKPAAKKTAAEKPAAKKAAAKKTAVKKAAAKKTAVKKAEAKKTAVKKAAVKKTAVKKAAAKKTAVKKAAAANNGATHQGAYA